MLFLKVHTASAMNRGDLVVGSAEDSLQQQKVQKVPKIKS